MVAQGIPLDALISSLEKLGEVNLVGKRFGVIKFRPQDDAHFFDIALPRKERSINFSGAYRDFEIQSDYLLPIEEDLARRDFTINAMAYDLRHNTIVDPFFGQKDLKAKTIRTVGSAATRFQEDYSRMLRAVRFASRFGFSISEKTAAAIKKMAHHLHDKLGDEWIVSRKRSAKNSSKPSMRVRVLYELMDELNLLKTVFPTQALQACKQTPPYHTEALF